jgi:hypothetical protein
MKPEPPARLGRPPKTGNENLSDRIIIRLTPSEHAAYDLAAKDAGLDRSEWMRKILNRAAKSHLPTKSDAQ